MIVFLRELAANQNVRQAAQSVGMNHTSAYRLRTSCAARRSIWGGKSRWRRGYRSLLRR